MASWEEFERQAPDVAAGGRATLFRSEGGDALLATVAGGGLPRIHPVNVGIVDGLLLVFVQEWSAKAKDLRVDGRYALHAVPYPAEPHEFAVRGRARLVADPTLRAEAVGAWPFRPGED
ncbi:MAG: pyridoxamine 5'-phosphate oxidase family protein, partial [Nocardioidaceae bacterium]